MFVTCTKSHAFQIGEEECAAVQNVTVQMNPQVIISTGGQEGGVQEAGVPLTLTGASVVEEGGIDSPTLQLVDQALITHTHPGTQHTVRLSAGGIQDLACALHIMYVCSTQ